MPIFVFPEGGLMKHEHGGHSSKAYVDIPKVVSYLLGKDDVFLDIGCGPGDYLKEAGKVSKNISGMDIHEGSVSSVRSSGIKCVLGDASKGIPFTDQSIDSILLANVLHGFIANKEDDAVLAEAARALKRRGLLGVVEFKKTSEIGPPADIKLSQSEVISRIVPEGFSQVEEVEAGPEHYLLVFRKK